MNKPFWFLFLALTTIAFGQNKEKEIFVKLIDQPILIDGDLSENIWEEAFKTAEFQQYFPSDSILAKQIIMSHACRKYRVANNECDNKKWLSHMHA